MKPLLHPRLWFAGWVLASVAVIVASLGSPPPGPDVRFGDKWMHLGTYLLLSVLAVQIFRPWRALVAAALYLVVLGVGLEVAQGTLTENRMMDWRDAIANAVGVVLGLAAALLPVRDALLRLERRWLGRSLLARER